MRRIVLTLACLALAISSTTAFAQAGKGKGGKPLAVGASFGDLGNPFFFTMGKGVEAAAKKIDPSAKVTVLSAGYDLNTQVGQIENFIASGVDMIILGAADTQGVGPVVKKNGLPRSPKLPPTERGLPFLPLPWAKAEVEETASAMQASRSTSFFIKVLLRL